jgi:hypothetical protein
MANSVLVTVTHDESMGITRLETDDTRYASPACAAASHRLLKSLQQLPYGCSHKMREWKLIFKARVVARENYLCPRNSTPPNPIPTPAFSPTSSESGD